jgi:hypothetical protein
LDKNSFINTLTDSSEILVFLIVLLKNGCWVFSVALKNIDQKVAFSIVDFEIGSFSLSSSSSIAS